MENIKTGDIVRPRLRKRYQELGEGVVVGVKKTEKKNVSIAFPTSDGVFKNYDFTDFMLVSVKAPLHTRLKMDQTFREYNKLMVELQNI